MWTVNFQMVKLVLEKAEEPEIKLPISAGSSKKQEFQKNIYFYFIDYAKAFDCVDHNKLWKILKERGIPDHLTCLLKYLCACQEATVRTEHGTTDWFHIGKGVYVKAVYCHHAYLTSMQSTSWETLVWRKHKLKSRLPGEISITPDMQMTTTLIAESEEELKSLSMKLKEESEKVGFSSTFRKLRSWHPVPSLHDK